MIEDWKPQWTANDIKAVAIPLLFLFSFVYGFGALRQCFDIINTVPWYSTILIGPLMGAYSAGCIMVALGTLEVLACVLIYAELTK